jgi:hypothetical protein
MMIATTVGVIVTSTVGTIVSEREGEGDSVITGVGSICSLRMVFFPQAGKKMETKRKAKKAKRVEVRECRIAEFL